MRNIFLTGASRCLGLALAKALCRDFTLNLSSRHSEDKFRKITDHEEVLFSGYYPLNFLENSSEFIENLRQLPPVSVLIHNAAPYTEEIFFKSSNEEIIGFGRFATNSALLFRNLQFLPKSKIIVIGSCSADQEYPLYAGGPLYSGYKSFIQSLALNVFKEAGAPSGVVINPGPINPDPTVQNHQTVPMEHVVSLVKDVIYNENNQKIIAIYPKSVTEGSYMSEDSKKSS